MREFFNSPALGKMVALYTRRGDTGKVSLAADPDDADADAADKANALRRELLEESRSGKAIELEIVAQTYAQGPSITNANCVDLSSEALAHLAKTAADTPFCRDHCVRTEDQGGYAISATHDRDGEVESLRERIVLSRPWSVEAALELLMRRFSISFWSDWRDILCLLCQAPMSECDHFPGQETDDGEVVIFRHQTVEWRERSWVVIPAVTETGVLGWEQLSARRSELRATRRRSRSHSLTTNTRKPMKELYKLFGLTEDDGSAKLVEKASKKLAALEAAEAENVDLKQVVGERDAVVKELAEVRAELADRQAKDLEVEAETAVAALLADGRIRPDGAQEKLLRARFASGDVQSARDLAAAFAENARVAPVGGRQSAESSRPSPTTASGNAPTGTGGDTPDGATGALPDIDYKAAFAALPEHLRQAGAKLSENPKRLFELNPSLLDHVRG